MPFLSTYKHHQRGRTPYRSSTPCGSSTSLRSRQSSQGSVNPSQGFTLIELMVSVALFSVVLVLSVSTLLVLIDANRKAQSLKSVINNLNFGVDSITRTLRTGHTFYCDDDVSDMPEGAQACANGAAGITLTADTGALVGYRLAGTTIERRIVDGGDDTDWIALTAPEVEISEFRFYVTGAAEDDGVQPTITLAVRGAAGVNLEADTSFNIQTTVTQRILTDSASGGGGGGGGEGEVGTTRTVVIKTWGAGGGGDNATQGGAGGFTTATYEIDTGTTLYVWVGTGGAGSPRIGASGAGGSPGGGTTGGTGGGGAGGGGYSGVFTSSSLAQANALVIAGGGGGESNHAGSGPGGAGGGTNGENAGGSFGAAGGTQTEGGAGNNQGADGSALQGGGGGGTSGGGGGWFGGGEGGDNGSTHSAGGGGSGYYRQSSLPTAISFTSGATYAGNNGTPPSQGTSDSDYPGGSVSYGGGNPGSSGYVVISVEGTKTTFSSGSGTSFTVN